MGESKVGVGYSVAAHQQGNLQLHSDGGWKQGWRGACYAAKSVASKGICYDEACGCTSRERGERGGRERRLRLIHRRLIR